MEDLDKVWTEILGNGPSPGTLRIVLSKLKEAGHLNRVIQECIKALNVYPDDFYIRQLLAESYLESGLTGQAESEIEKVITRFKDLVSVYKLQAEIYNRQGRVKEAVQALKSYIAHRPEDEESFDLLQKLEAMEEVSAPEPVPAVDEEPLIPEESLEEVSELATPKLAEIYFDQGLIQEAIYTYEKVLQQKPDDEHSMKRLGELNRMITDAEEPDKKLDPVRQKKEKMITILEDWLGNIQETQSLL